MKLEINLSGGIVPGDDVRQLIDLAGIDERLFRQRKSYDEYYFDGNGKQMEFPAENIFILADAFPVEIHCNSITITVG